MVLPKPGPHGNHSGISTRGGKNIPSRLILRVYPSPTNTPHLHPRNAKAYRNIGPHRSTCSCILGLDRHHVTLTGPADAIIIRYIRSRHMMGHVARPALGHRLGWEGSIVAGAHSTATEDPLGGGQQSRGDRHRGSTVWLSHLRPTGRDWSRKSEESVITTKEKSLAMYRPPPPRASQPPGVPDEAILALELVPKE
jgi:hypothetical protein